jgi:hypothetical protein
MVKFNCAGCGESCSLEKELDKEDSDWDYYEDQYEDFIDGYHVKHMKITHCVPWCGVTNLVMVKFIAAEVKSEKVYELCFP